jgi:hypothetical protein
MTIKTPRIVQNAIDAYYLAKYFTSEEFKYEMMIAESQAKLAETTLVPGYTQIYA